MDSREVDYAARVFYGHLLFFFFFFFIAKTGHNWNPLTDMKSNFLQPRFKPAKECGFDTQIKPI